MVKAGGGFSPAHKQDLADRRSSSSHLLIPAYAWHLAEGQKKHGREGCRRVGKSIGTSSPTQQPHIALRCQAQDNLVTIPWECSNATFVTTNQRLCQSIQLCDWTFESTDYYFMKGSHWRNTNSNLLSDGPAIERILRHSVLRYWGRLCTQKRVGSYGSKSNAVGLWHLCAFAAGLLGLPHRLTCRTRSDFVSSSPIFSRRKTQLLILNPRGLFPVWWAGDHWPLRDCPQTRDQKY